MNLTDQVARTRIDTQVDRHLFVEAGAGSGKTHHLVGRICALVAAGEALAGIAAITFTEKAAAELRSRVGARLADHEKTPMHATLRARALDQLDTAPIGTIHSFAARVLSENPIEAGLPPLIEVMDELRSRIAFTRRWEQARAALFADPAASHALDVLLTVGVSLGNLEDVARKLDESWDRLEGLRSTSTAVPPLDVLPLLTELGEALALREHCTHPDDKLLPALTRLASWHDQLSAALRNEDELEQLALVAEASEAFKGITLGAKTNWKCDLVGLKQTLKNVKDASAETLQRMIEPAINRIVFTLADVLLREARLRQRSGRLEFNDLLVHCRDLLVGTPQAAVQRLIHERYPRILLDEFQDTDPVQAEIAVRIAANGVADRGAWRSRRVEPGRLFMVGDPKQSIYRFRRADIATYLEQQDLSIAADAESVVALTTNFRSTTPVLAWVNDVFGQLIVAEEHAQPAYVPLLVAPDRPEWSDGLGPAVSVLGTTAEDEEALAEAKAPQVREREARDIAAMILRAIGEGDEPAWQKEAPGSGGFARSPVELKDICILIPSRTSLSALEEALTSANIEFTAEASSLVYSTQEIHDLLLALRALANTADEAALALTLRTPLFGVSDDELLVWKSGLGRWGLYSQIPEDLESHPIADALLYLRELHGDLGVLAPADLLSRLVSDRRMLEAVTDSPRYRDVWRRIRFVIDQAQAWSDATHGSLREYLVWARAQQEDNARVIEAIVPETGMNAVRITTIHMSKGREFPVVIVGGSSTSPRASSQPVLWLDDQPVVRLIKGVANAAHEGAAAIEKAFDEAERTRLLYVACTRAESHLVVSLYQGTKPCPGRQLREVHNESLSDQPVLEHGRRITGEPPVTAVGALPDWAMWELERAAWRDASAIPASMPVTVLAKGKSAVAQLPLSTVTFVDTEDLAFPAFLGGDSQHGTELGIAVHRVLELSDLRIDERLPQIATDVARAAGLPASTLEAMARSALLSEPVARASTREHWLELPITGTSGGIVLEGVADLVYREDDGSLVVVDFKTDLGVREEAVEGYWRQLSAYAELISNATGESVSGLVLVYCRSAVAHVRRRRASNSFLSGV